MNMRYKPKKQIVFHECSQDEFLEMLRPLGVASENYDSPLKPPCGTIFVGTDIAADSWIRSRRCFYGWNIILVGIPSDRIKFK